MQIQNNMFDTLLIITDMHLLKNILFTCHCVALVECFLQLKDREGHRKINNFKTADIVTTKEVKVTQAVYYCSTENRPSWMTVPNECVDKGLF